MTEFVTKPILLYVHSNGVSEMDMQMLGVEVERFIDVQMSEQDAKTLMDILRKKLAVEVYGGISFRLKGRLVW